MSDERISLILALHNHQPEGNLPEVFERTFKTAYEPFVRELENFPGIRVTMHYSGILLRWFKENRPEFLARLRRLVEQGRVEMMGGAFFEPILVMIPDEDKTGQIRMQSSFLAEHFGVEARGAWLPERVWEPHLARPLHEAGITYTVLDDAHFKHVGFSEEDTLYYYITEEGGSPLSVFPISEKLRYLIPFADPRETIDYLRGLTTPGGGRVVVLADDGEKFGSWPGTAHHVYAGGWLKRFFSLLWQNRDWLEVTGFEAFMRSHPPKGRVYLPAGSYREMLEWSGGFWRNFFVRYPESNHIHKKMLHVREKLLRLPEGPLKAEAREYLWAGQCNCAYWHGVFGGLYLNFLRSALYSRLIAAEVLVDSARHQNGAWVEMEQKDFDYDGREEVLVNGPDLGLVFAPALGGALLELDYKPRRFNLNDVLTRRPEPYHCNIFELAEGRCATDEVKTIHHIARVKEAGLEHLLIYDRYRRASLLDHFFAVSTTLDDFSKDPAGAEAGDFPGNAYQLEEAAVNGTARLTMSRTGQVRAGGNVFPLALAKSARYIPGEGTLVFDYRLVNEGEKDLDIYFGVEFNISLLAGEAADRYFSFPDRNPDDARLASRGEEKNVVEFALVDQWQGLESRFLLNRPAELWRLPVETVSQSEDGFERVYQGSCVLPRWRLKLKPRHPREITVIQRVTGLRKEGH